MEGKDLRKAGLKVTLPMLKQRVNLDVQRSKLYPSPDYVAAINRKVLDRVMVVPQPKPGEKAAKGSTRSLLPKGSKIPALRVDYASVRPPTWHTQDLAESGQLKEIVQFLDGFGKE